jgi:hypothetical protein
MFLSKFLMDNYFRGNDFATIKKFRTKNILSKFLLNNYSRGNNFPRIKKNFDQKFCGQNS